MATAWISTLAWKKLSMYRAKHFPLETGGILLGYLSARDDFEHWVITRVTGPGPKAKHNRFWFCPDDAYHSKIAVHHYQSRDGTEYYLGDWHTHPNGSAATSWLDRKTLFKNSCVAGHTADRSIMLIVGGGIDSAIHAVYVGDKKAGICGYFKQPECATLNMF